LQAKNIVKTQNPVNCNTPSTATPKQLQHPSNCNITRFR